MLIPAPVSMIIKFWSCCAMSVPNWANIAVSRFSMDTSAADRLTIFAVDMMGLPIFLYFTISTIDMVRA